MKVKAITDVNLSGKRAMVREDLNVPMQNGKISNDARLKAALPTINAILEAGAQVIITSHLGRPKPGQYDAEFSLGPVAEYLRQALGRAVAFTADWQSGLSESVADADIILLENVRFLPGETENSPVLAKQFASLCDVFVMDAFGSAHRAHASTSGVCEYAKQACAGPLLLAELKALEKVMVEPKRPLVAVVGGAKVSSKLVVLEQLSKKVDLLVVGGGIANTFLAVNNNVGKSLIETDLISIAEKIMQTTDVFLPADVMVATEFSKDAIATVKNITDLADEDMILDIGPQACHQLHERIAGAGTILWNGPMGVFEFEAFSAGTRILGEAISQSKAFSLAGGGVTLAAIEQFKLEQGISYISTGGGALLEYLEGQTLPAVAVLEARGFA